MVPSSLTLAPGLGHPALTPSSNFSLSSPWTQHGVCPQQGTPAPGPWQGSPVLQGRGNGRVLGIGAGARANWPNQGQKTENLNQLLLVDWVLAQVLFPLALWL